MKTALLFSLFIASFSFGAVPEPIITYKGSANSHATIAGKLSGKTTGIVGISVRNGGVTYSTITDHDGKWGVVIRHLSTSLEVTSWSLTDFQDRATIQDNL